MRIQQHTEGDVVVLNVHGNIVGGPEFDAFHKQIKDLAEGGNLRVLLNLEDVGFINSAGVGIILTAFTTLKRKGGTLKIAQFNDRLETMFFTIGLRSILELYPTEAEALASFAAPD